MTTMTDMTQTWTKEEVLAVAEEWREKARRTFLEDGEHRPISFVFGTKNHETGEPLKSVGIVPVFGNFDDNSKSGYAAALRDIVKQTGGVGVIFITEMWMVKGANNGVDGPDSPEAVKWRGKLHLHPDRSEHLMVTCEHYRFGCLMWTAEILRPAGEPEGKPIGLGPWLREGHFLEDGEQPKVLQKTGRFVNILPQVS